MEILRSIGLIKSCCLVSPEQFNSMFSCRTKYAGATVQESCSVLFYSAGTYAVSAVSTHMLTGFLIDEKTFLFMITALQSSLSIMQFQTLWVLKRKIIFFLKQELLQIFTWCKEIVEKPGVYNNKNAIFPLKLHMLHTTKCCTSTLKICYAVRI